MNSDERDHHGQVHMSAGSEIFCSSKRDGVPKAFLDF